MPRQVNNGGLRLKRRVEDRDGGRPADHWRPSSEASHRDSNLHHSLLKGKVIDPGGATHRWDSRSRDPSPDHWRSWDQPFTSRGRRSRFLVRSPPHPDSSPPRWYNPPHHHPQLPPIGNSNRNQNGKGKFMKNKKSFPRAQGGAGLSSPVPPIPLAVSTPLQAPAAPSAPVVTCFNYGEDEHYQVGCPNPPLRYLCKRPVRPTLLCPDQSLEGELMLYGHGITGMAFFHVEVEDIEAATPPLTALISILGDKTTSPATITDELRHLFRPDWDWAVTPISDREFTTVFPDPISLRYATHSAGLTLALNKINVSISIPTVDPLAAVVLETVWLQIRGLPSIAKKKRVIHNMSRILGKIIEVDELSLFKGDAVRVKVKMVDSSKLQATVRVFFHDIGYDLHISVEGAVRGGSRGPEGAGDFGGDQGNGRGGGRDIHHRRRGLYPGSEEDDDELSDPDDAPKHSAHRTSKAGTSPTTAEIEAIVVMLEEAATTPHGGSP
ncbi:hypothetical protein D1007_36297 [Hordeum vulgare]|nr:hypothetical protein D1007_36297 [Hordeum vulgare]